MRAVCRFDADAFSTALEGKRTVQGLRLTNGGQGVYYCAGGTHRCLSCRLTARLRDVYQELHPNRGRTARMLRVK